MVLLPKKLSRSLKFHSKAGKKDSEILLASLDDFRSKISNFLKELTLLKPGKAQSCFELIIFTHRAFMELENEIDYPMSQWGDNVTNMYLDYTLIFLEKLNLITSSLTHINQTKLSISNALHLIMRNMMTSAPTYLKKLQGNINPKVVGSSSSTGTEKKPSAGSVGKEGVILEALMVLRTIGFYALGSVLSGFWIEDANPCPEIGKAPGWFDDLLKRSFLESENRGPMEKVKEVNRVVERLSEGMYKGKCDEAVCWELKGKLEVLGNCIQGIEKQVNNLFSEVLGSRRKLLDSISS
ncbi:hypothetical protein OROGR_004073 [Orobanche gracilis]